MKPKLQELAQTLDRVLHTNDWTVDVINWPVALAPGLSQFQSDTKKSFIRALSVDLPKWEVTPVQITHRGYILQLPSIWDTTRSFTVTFLETADKPVHKFLEAWREVVAQINWSGSSSRDYKVSSVKADFRITLYNRKQELILEYFLHGVFPISVDYGQLVGERGADIFRITATFSFDFYYSN